MSLLLDVGCGIKKKEGYFGIDKMPYPNVDCVCDIGAVKFVNKKLVNQGLPFADNSVDGIYTSHFLEHTQNLEFVMEEFWRVLKPHGIIDVRVPHWAGILAHSEHHTRFFNYMSFEYFTDNPDRAMWGSAKARFKIKERRLVYRTSGFSKPYGELMNGLSNIRPLYFEAWLSHLLPPSEIYFKLKVIK